MLVVDGIDQRLADDGGTVGGVEDEGAVGGQQRTDTGHDVAEIVQVGEGVVGDDQPCPAVGFKDLAGQGGVEEARQRRRAGGGCAGGDLLRRIDAKDPQAEGLEGAEQGAVVAADLDHQVPGGGPRLSTT